MTSTSLANNLISRMNVFSSSALHIAIRADAPAWGRALASAGSVTYAGNHWGMPCTLGLSGLNQITAWTSKADLDLGGAPTPCEGVQQSNVAEEHVLPAVTAAEGCEVAVIRQGQGGVAVAGAGGLPLHL